MRDRVSGDWVYRACLYDETGGALDSIGSYDPTEQTVVAGFGNSGGCVLYDSHNYVNNIATLFGQAAGNYIPLAAPARPEGRTSKVIRVQGNIIWRPSSWAVGSSFRLGLRFGIWEQDPTTGSIVAPAAENMWSPIILGALDTHPVFFANTRSWQKEYRISEQFSENTVRFEKAVNFKVNRRLKPNECYALWVETSAGSTTLLFQYWLRTFVADEGA